MKLLECCMDSICFKYKINICVKCKYNKRSLNYSDSFLTHFIMLCVLSAELLLLLESKNLVSCLY